MAVTELSAAACLSQGVRRSATPSGVRHVREYQPERYTIVGNHLAQHGELSLTAIGLAAHILSLPECAAVDIRSLAERFPEGRDRIAFALRELEAAGYIARVRERVAGGRVITRTYAYHAPARTRARGEVADLTDVVEVADAVEVAEPGGLAKSAESAELAIGSVVAPVASVNSVASVTPVASEEVSEEAEPEPPRSEHHDKAEALLVGLRRTDSRLMLSLREVRRLVPLVVAWFDNGVRRADVYYALTSDPPAILKNPAGFLAYRLRELLPPPSLILRGYPRL